MATLPLAPSSPEFGKLKAFAHELMGQKVWTPATVVALGGSLASEVNRLSGLSGLQKKQLVLDVIKAVLADCVKKSTDVSGSPLASKEFVDSLNFVLESVLPASLDLAVAAARGQLDLKKVKKSAFAGFLLCLPHALGLCGVSKSQAQVVVSQVETVAKQVDPSLSESDTTNPLSETAEAKDAEKKTLQDKNNLAAGVVIRVPEATPQSAPQTV